jgi:hypothetical protein
MMAWRKVVVLKTGEEVLLRDLSPEDSPRELAAFVNALVHEKTYVNQNNKMSVKEEKIWLKNMLKKVKQKNNLQIIAEWNDYWFCLGRAGALEIEE